MNSKYFKKCIFLFYLLGQNSYNLPAQCRYRAWLQHIPRIFCLFVAFASICRICDAWHQQQQPVSLVMHIIFAVTFSINALVFVEYFTVPNGIEKLNATYKDAIDYLERKMYTKIDYDYFERSFRCKLHVILWTCLLTLAIKMLFVSNGDIPAFETIWFLLYYLKHFTFAHILLHIDFVQFLMQTINREFDPNCEQFDFMIKMAQPKTIVLLQTVRHLKCIHFRVWKIVQVLNIRFGWILIALMLVTLLDISYSTYWMWVFIHRACYQGAEIVRLMRKYFRFSICFFDGRAKDPGDMARNN